MDFGFYCIAFIEYIAAGKNLLDCTNLFSPNNYQKEWQSNIYISIIRKNMSSLQFRNKYR